ncbi:MAG: glycine--tRNA ligase, partial [Candidatus Neomarinimicrobiota bacterium]
MDLRSIENIVSLCKRRGFIFQSSEIYGGMASTWDYGPLGVEMKNRIKQNWWHAMVTSRDNVVGMDAAIFMLPEVWEASGHVQNFHDPLVDNKRSKKRYRLDHLLEEQKRAVLEKLWAAVEGDAPCPQETDHLIPHLVTALNHNRADSGALLQSAGVRDPHSGEVGDWTNARQFNLMFKTAIGPVEDSGEFTYLRPETAQGIFVNFTNVQSTSRQKLPFGIAQIGKAFRNEITTGNFLFRTREFEQMEMEFFIPAGENARWLEYWSQERLGWFRDLGIRPEKLRLRPHDEDELAHYSSACYDVEYEFPFGWSELGGVANRTDYDLKSHSRFSGEGLEYFDEKEGKKYFPY